MARYGDNHKGGRPTKAEEFGLHKNLNEAFKRATKGKFGDAEVAILEMMWKKAQDGDYKAIEWLSHRYYGKEPDALVVDANVDTNVTTSLQDFINNATKE